MVRHQLLSLGDDLCSFVTWGTPLTNTQDHPFRTVSLLEKNKFLDSPAKAMELLFHSGLTEGSKQPNISSAEEYTNALLFILWEYCHKNSIMDYDINGPLWQWCSPDEVKVIRTRYGILTKITVTALQLEIWDDSTNGGFQINQIQYESLLRAIFRVLETGNNEDRKLIENIFIKISLVLNKDFESWHDLLNYIKRTTGKKQKAA